MQRILGAALLASVALAFSAGALPAQADLTCADLPGLEGQLLQMHIRYRTPEPVLFERAAETTLQRLDPQRILFLAPEAEQVRLALVRAAADIQRGDCSRLIQTRADVLARTAALEAEVRTILTDPKYAVDPNAELVLDPEERGWPATQADRQRVVLSLVHFQVSGAESDGQTLEQAKKRILHRFELRTKRTRELAPEELLASYLDAFATSLDPHSNYFSNDYYEDFRIQMQLSLEGIGVALQDQEGTAVVQQIIPGSAAAREGSLREGDKILEVAQEGGEPVDIADMALNDIVKMIRGPKGTRVHLTVFREASPPQRFKVAIERAQIDLEDQAAKLEFRNEGVDGRTLKLAVLELPQFYGDPADPSHRLASRDVRRLLEQARREKADGLLLDLSVNGGGLLEDAVRIAGFFIQEGGIVKVKEGYRSQVLRDPEGGIRWAGPLVILTSRVSASASEIVAGALQDYHRAVVVGDAATFGKGTVQTLVERRSLGALKVTTAMFFRPGGASTQHEGVRADVPLPSLLTPDLVGESTEENALPAERVGSFVSEQRERRARPRALDADRRPHGGGAHAALGACASPATTSSRRSTRTWPSATPRRAW